METKFYTQLLKEQNKLRNRLARKSYEKREVEKDLEQLLTNHMAILKNYRVAKFNIDRYLEKINEHESNTEAFKKLTAILTLLMTMSISLNLYFILK